jgi:hypothetical protein
MGRHCCDSGNPDIGPLSGGSPSNHFAGSCGFSFPSVPLLNVHRLCAHLSLQFFEGRGGLILFFDVIVTPGSLDKLDKK